MPKMKTRKCIAKRVKRTASGKYMISKPGRRHLMSSKTSKRKRNMRKDAMLPAAHNQRLQKALPYGV
jgi:large subunit ribosomal protein L35